MSHQTVSHYRIIRKIGSGGMGEVFEAVDTRLDRKVALKFFVSGSVPDEEAKSRFMQEARAASALDHPNVCVLHDVGETRDGRLFLAMAHYEGETLKSLISRGPLSSGRALGILRQVGAGLAEAHARGIVHRDIKPSNIFITRDGMVKILDFGLAKLSTGVDITKAGSPIGSVLYMSPEQARGEEIDHRSDLWSMGTLLYEMLTGRRPFQGTHDHAVMYAILHEPPADLTELVPDVPPDIAAFVAACLEKDRADRPDSVRAALDLIGVDESTRTVTMPPPRSERSRLLRRAWPAAVLVLALLVLLPRWLNRTATPPGESWLIIADPVNRAGDRSLAPLLEEALTVGLQQSRHVKVFAGQRRDLALGRMGLAPGDSLPPAAACELAEREGVPAVLASSIERGAGGYQVAVRLLDPATGDPIHADVVRAPDQTALFAELDRVTRRIRQRLGESAHAISRDSEPLARVTTPSLEALRFYSLGVHEQDRDRAISLLRQAVAADPDFAMAHARLARELMYSASTEEALEHSGRAFDLRGRLPVRERLYVEGEYYRLRAQYRQAIESMTALLELHPEDTACRTNLVHAYMFLIQYQNALEQFDLLDPAIRAGRVGRHTRGLLLGGLGRYAEAEDEFRAAVALAPGPALSSRLCLVQTLICDGRVPTALAELDTILALDTEAVIGADYMAGRTLPALGRFRASAEHLRKARNLALAVGDSNRAAWADIYLAMGHAVRRDQQARLADLRQAVEFWPGDVPTFMLGEAAAAAGDTAEAARVEAVLRAMTADDPTNRNRRSLTKLEGVLAFHRNDLGEAIRLLKECPLDLDARLLLGRAQAAAGDLAAAREEFRYVVDNRFHAFIEGLVTVWPLAYYYLGVTDQLAGDDDAAREHLGRFAALWAGADEGTVEVEDARVRLEQLKIED